MFTDGHELKLLLLCGGRSRRMGCAKYSMVLKGRPLAAHLIERMRAAYPEAEKAYVSLRDPSQLSDGIFGDDVLFLYDTDHKSTFVADAGPAAGLLAAHSLDTGAHWLVVACDYPLLSTADLRHLLDRYQSPLTCFQNAEGWPEPLLAIWSPSSLGVLQGNVDKGITGPIKTLRGLNTTMLAPQDERSLINTNTPSDWEAALQAGAQSGLC